MQSAPASAVVVLTRTMLVTILLLIGGCDVAAVRNAIDDFDVIIQLEPIETFAVGQVIDAGTGNLVEADLSIEFGGADAGTVVDFYSDPVSTMRVRGGMFMVGVSRGITPSPASPVHVQVRVSAPGYHAAVANLRMEAPGEHAFDVVLAATNGSLAGTSTAGAQSWLSNGRTLGFTLDTGDGGGAGWARIHIPGGVALTSATGKQLAGTLTADLTYFSPSSTPVLSAFPGGFRRLQIVREGVARSESFVTAAFLNLSARSSEGDRAAHFSEPLERLIEIAPGLNNPATGVPYVPGEVVSVLHFDARSGRWQAIAEGRVEAASSKDGGGLLVRYASERTGFEAIGDVVPMCEEGLVMDVRRNGHAGTIRGYLRARNGSGYYRSIILPAGEDHVRVPDLPSGIDFDLRLDLPSGVPVTRTLSSGCGGTFVVDLPAPTSKPVDVTFSIQLSCVLKLQPPFNATVNYKRRSAPGGGVSAGVPEWWTDEHGRVVGGALIIPGMYLGETYRFILVTPDRSLKHNVTVDDPSMYYEFTVPSDLCRR